jgi:IS30 family transposase
MKTSSHLSSAERDKITILQGEGLSIRTIAKELGRSPSTISRELNRANAVFFRGKYIGSQTDKNVKQQWSKSHKRTNKYLSMYNVRKYISIYLKYGYSPAIISHLLDSKYGIHISHETLYSYIYKKDIILAKYLLRRKYGRKPRKKRLYKPNNPKNIPNRTDIDLREELANLRMEFGHYECDSVESCKKKGKTKPCLTVMVERMSRKVIISKTASKTSKSTTTSIIKVMKPYVTTIKSITYDNGCEFSMHEKINKMLNTKSYFCKPYSAWEKGTVENINGIIRRFFPKGTDFGKIKMKQIKYVENWINNRPMKVLNYLTPNEMFQHLYSVAIAS